MKNSDDTDDQVTRWRRHIDKYLLLSWKTVLIIAGVWLLSGVLNMAIYGPFSDYFEPKDRLGSTHVWVILQDENGVLWFGTSYGVSRYDGTSWQTFTTKDGLADNDINSILQDGDGNLWVSTLAGVSRYDGTLWQTFTTKDGLADNRVKTILQDEDGNLWFPTFAGVSRYDGTSWQTFTTKDGLANNEIMSILQDTDGNLWFGTCGGVSRYDGTSWQTFTPKIDLVPNAVLILFTVLPAYFLISLVYTVIRIMEPDQYLLLSWKKLLLIPAWVLLVVLFVVIYNTFASSHRGGYDVGVFFLIATLVIPLFLIISLVYTVIRKVVKLVRNRTS